MLNNPWAFGWDSVFAIVLILTTLWIAWRQNKIQQQIADRDAKLQNYQHRSKIYMQIVQSSEFMSKAHGFSIGHLYQGTNIPFVAVEDLHKGNSLMLKSQLEAKLLFSPKLARMIYVMFDTYSEYTEQFTNFYMTNPNLQSRLKDIDFDKYALAPKYPEILDKVKHISPELASIMELQHKIMTMFKSKEFNDSLLSEIKL